MLAYDREAVPLGEVLDRQVALLRGAHRVGDPVAAELLRGTGAKGTDEELLGSALTEEAARLAIALDHGYAGWGAARADADLSVDTGSRRPRTRSSGASSLRCATCSTRIHR